MGTTIGTLFVRRSIFINASPARVWQEFDSEPAIKSWLGIGHTVHSFEPHVGAVTDFSVTIEDEQVHFGGRILQCIPEQELTFESQWQNDSSWQVPTLWTIRLTPLYEGTHVELFHHGFERLGEQAADNLQSYEQGWDVKHLTALRSIAET